MNYEKFFQALGDCISAGEYANKMLRDEGLGHTAERLGEIMDDLKDLYGDIRYPAGMDK